MFGMNPEYVPGGVHNFWTRSPPAEGDGPAHATAVGTEGLTTAATAVATEGAMMTKRGGFLTGFFTNSEYVAPPLQAEVSFKGAMMKEDAKVKQHGGAWAMPKLTLDFYALPPLNGSY